MRAVTIILRFVQLLAIIPIGLGISNASSFFELLSGLAQGMPWDYPLFAKRLVVFSCPLGLGLAFLVGLELLLRRGRVRHARSLNFPDQPWLWNPMWAARRIRLSNLTSVALCLTALGLFSFVAVPVGMWMASQKAATPVYVFLGLLGTFLLAVMRMMWINRRWGRSELEILTLPGVIGGPFRGQVLLNELLPEGTALRVTLKCIRQRTYRSRQSGELSSETDTIWQDQKVLITSLSMSQPDAIAIPCSFVIPFSCEPTSLDTITFSTSPVEDPDEYVSIHWQLSVGMKDPIDLREAAFEIPVFKTGDSSPCYQEDESVDAPYLEHLDINALLKSIPLQREYSISGQRLRFSMFRRRDFFLLLAFALAVSIGVWAILRYVSMPIALFAAFLPAALAIFSYVALVQGMAWEASIEITAQMTTFTAGYLWLRRRYEYPRGTLPSLEIREESRRESGSSYCVRVVPAQGPPCDIVKRLDSKQNAVAIRKWLMKELWKA